MRILETERLILRTWKKEDTEVYFEINNDPKVIKFLKGPLNIEEVKEFIIYANTLQEKHRYSLWAAEIKKTSEFIGFIGLNYIDWPAHFTPTVEIGWRLSSKYWNNGYATEGAKAALNYGFNQCKLNQIVAITTPANIASINVMEKIGMKRDFDGDFLHPKLDKNHPLAQHILYRISNALTS
jgi:RimJ/RimL family protein N-acetyltransferase